MRRILIADDDDAMREWLRELLAPPSSVLREAATGWQLLAILADDGPFDLVITDVRMPMPSGLQVVAMARAAGLATPFLVITAFPTEQTRRGVDGMEGVLLLAKPFSSDELRAAIGVLAAAGPAA